MNNSLLEPNKNILECISNYVLTDIGIKRESNQDNFIVVNGENFRLFVVCDGMGGTEGGEIASQMTISYLESKLSGKKINDIEDVKVAVSTVNQLVFDYGMEHKEVQGLGTTITSLLVMQKGSWILNVGDSRIYKVSDNTICQITQDDTVLNELIKSGVISEEKAKNHPIANMLTKTIGQGKSLEIETKRLGFLNYSDKFLLCSDGLYNMVSNEEILGIVSKYNPRDAVKHLVNTANANGGADNITVMIVGVFSHYNIDSEDDFGEDRPAVGQVHEISNGIDYNELSKKFTEYKSDQSNSVNYEEKDSVINKTDLNHNDNDSQKVQFEIGDFKKFFRVIFLIFLIFLCFIFFPSFRETSAIKNVNKKVIDQIGNIQITEQEHKFNYDYSDSKKFKTENLVNYKLKERESYISILNIIDNKKEISEKPLLLQLDGLLNISQKLEQKIKTTATQIEIYQRYNNQDLIKIARDISEKDNNVKKKLDDYLAFSYDIIHSNLSQEEYESLRNNKIDALDQQIKKHIHSNIKELNNSLQKYQNDLFYNQFKISIINLKLEYANLLKMKDEDNLKKFKLKINALIERLDKEK